MYNYIFLQMFWNMEYYSQMCFRYSSTGVAKFHWRYIWPNNVILIIISQLLVSDIIINTSSPKKKKNPLSDKQWLSRRQEIIYSTCFFWNEWHIAVSHLSLPKARLINCDPEISEWIFIPAILGKRISYIICTTFSLSQLPLQ